MKMEDSTTEPLLLNGGHVTFSEEQKISAALAKKIFWYLVMIAVHCGWGILPVNARYIQTQAQPPMGAFRLGFYIAAFASVSLLFFTYLPVWIRRALSKPQPGDTVRPAIPKDRFWEWVYSISILSVALGALAFGQIFATNFTSGDWVQLISMTAPVFVALLSALLLGTPVPKVLYPTLMGVLIGGGLVIYGGMQQVGKGMEITGKDFVGFGISFIATLGMAVFYVYVQKTEGLVAEDQVLVCEYAVMVLSLPPLSVLLEQPDWGAILHYDWVFWAHMIFCSVLVYYGCNLAQQFVIRNVGASVYAMTSAIRLVASIIASWILLGERITSWLQWVGCLIVMVCISVYLYMQFYGHGQEGAGVADVETADESADDESVIDEATAPVGVAARTEPVAIAASSWASNRDGGFAKSGSFKQRSFVGTPGTLPC